MALSVVGRSKKVAEKILEYYRDASERRDEHVTKQINETLKEGEAGMLIMSDEYRMHIQTQLPPDIQIFLVRPPALNDIQQLLQKMLQS
jgi:guanylate kinase